MMGVIRITKKERAAFVQIDLKTVCDSSISPQELGLLTYLLSKKDDYEFRVSVIARERNLSERQVYRILDRLIKAGYVHRILHRIQTKQGRWRSISRYEVFELREMCQEYRDRIKFGRPEVENEVAELPLCHSVSPDAE